MRSPYVIYSLLYIPDLNKEKKATKSLISRLPKVLNSNKSNHLPTFISKLSMLYFIKKPTRRNNTTNICIFPLYRLFIT